MPTLTAVAKHLGVSVPRAHQLKAKGMPVNTLRAAKLWKDANQRRAAVNGKTAKLQTKRKGRPRKPVKLSKSGDTLADILKNAIARAEVAHLSYADAAAGNESGQAVLLSNSTKAAEAVARLEKMVREEQERRKILVPRSEIVESCRRAMNVMLVRLKKLPNETGPQCAGLDALQSVRILQRAVDEILLAGQGAMNEI